MRYLLDTHILIWSLELNPKLNPKATKIIENSENEIFYSMTSLWEVAIKHRKKPEKFNVPVLELLHYCEQLNFTRLNIRDLNILEFEKLPLLHSDPFDNMLVAQAKSEGLILITHDEKLGKYGRDVMVV